MKKEDADHFAFLRTLLCSVCLNNTSVEVAHIKYSDFDAGKVHPGMGAKDHEHAVTLCSDCHRKQHKISERIWWRTKGINPITLSRQLRKHTGNAEACERIIRTWGFRGL